MAMTEQSSFHTPTTIDKENHMQYQGKTKLILKHLGFLREESGLNFAFQSFDSYHGFCGPIDTYSFYNDFGCFTLHHIVQKGEWAWYKSSKFSKSQYKLLETEINQSNYISQCFFLGSVLKKLSESIQSQIALTNEFFDIPIGF